MLRGMAVALVRELGGGRWGLVRARAVAREVEGARAAVRALVAAMFDGEVKVRKRAAGCGAAIDGAQCRADVVVCGGGGRGCWRGCRACGTLRSRRSRGRCARGQRRNDAGQDRERGRWSEWAADVRAGEVWGNLGG